MRIKISLFLIIFCVSASAVIVLADDRRPRIGEPSFKCDVEIKNPENPSETFNGYFRVYVEGKIHARVLFLGYEEPVVFANVTIEEKDRKAIDEALQDEQFAALVSFIGVDAKEAVTVTTYGVRSKSPDGPAALIFVFHDSRKKVLGKGGYLGWTPVVCKK